MAIELVGLVAYPSSLAQAREAIIRAVNAIRTTHGQSKVLTWEENDVAGRFIVGPVLSRIQDGNILIADITRLNFNVAYEIGYAIGLRKRVFLIKNKAFTEADTLIREIGLFDTLGYSQYENSIELTDLIAQITDLTPISLDATRVNNRSPVYMLLPRVKADEEIRIISRVKKARLPFRSFDPEEQGRLSAGEAIENVVASHGVIIPLLSAIHTEYSTHNIRAAFVAGLTHALDRVGLLLQAGYDPIPLDYRDMVNSYLYLDQIDEHIAELVTDVTERLTRSTVPVLTEPTTFLSRLILGASAAENEMLELGTYYLETDEYFRTLRGEVQIVAGRKGSGKTALFAQVRNSLRSHKPTIVVDLKPEGFQLLKFKQLVLELLEEGSKEHTITAFWEYLLLLEICHKVLEKDKDVHKWDHQLYDQYQSLAQSYLEDKYVSEGDFAERMLTLTQRIGEDFREALRDTKTPQRLTGARVTELLYVHDIAKLSEQVTNYLTLKQGVWILFDNIDKGWPAHGIGSDDLLILRALLDAIAKLQRSLRRAAVECHGVIFIRNDVYELLVESTPDRGKVSRVTLDWTDAELLRELLRRRFIRTGVKGNPPFDHIWREICVTHIGGEESSQYMIDRCLMRPRALIELLRHCRSRAVNLTHGRITVEDIETGESAYSTDLITEISLEIRDVAPDAKDAIYEFVEAPTTLSYQDIENRLKRLFGEPQRIEEVLELLLWHGFLGLLRPDGDVTYIYSVKYNMSLMRALFGRHGANEAVYFINPAFWRGLEIRR